MARVTVEDCLDRIPSRFALVIIATRRARQLLRGAEPRVRRSNRECVTALREIASGAVYVEENLVELIEHNVEPHRGPKKGY